jgi:hypothetical protein
MPEHRLSDEEAAKARVLLDYVRKNLESLSSNDPELLHAYRRRIMNRLESDERTTSMNRKKLKRGKYKSQEGLCAICLQVLPKKYAVLDRLETTLGYTEDNTRLIHEDCDRREQAERGYTRYTPPSN